MLPLTKTPVRHSRRKLSSIYRRTALAVSRLMQLLVSCVKFAIEVLSMWTAPAFWMSIVGFGVSYPDPNTPPVDYPINRATGASRYMRPIQPKPSRQACDPRSSRF